MKQIKVPLTPKEWAEKRLQLLIDWNNDATNYELDSFIERCGFYLLEEIKPETKPDEIPTDKVEAVKYFLNQLPSGYRERALAQVDEENIKTRYTTAINILDAVIFFNTWHKTKEGTTFWLYVHDHYKSPTDYPTLPPLPNE